MSKHNWAPHQKALPKPTEPRYDSTDISGPYKILTKQHGCLYPHVRMVVYIIRGRGITTKEIGCIRNTKEDNNGTRESYKEETKVSLLR